MTTHTREPVTTLHWEGVGAWQAGTAAGVALTHTGGSVRGLLASAAGAYFWSQPQSPGEPLQVEPLLHGMSDPHVVAVAFAGGDTTVSPVALAATATGRLFRTAFDTSSDASGAGYAVWQEMRSWAGLGVAVVLAPSPAFAEDQTLFVGTPTGIFRTQDDGQSWESCNFGLLDEDVLCMVCAPDFAASELLWAGTAGGGLYRSRNSARAWRESGIGLPDAAVQSLTVSPNFGEDRILFAGMETYGVYCSRDGGESWTSLALAGQSVNTLACQQPDLLWAGTADGIWRIDVGSGESVQVSGAGETVMTLAATANGHVAAGMFGSGLWVTEDGRGDPQSILWQRPHVALHAPPVVARIGHEIFALDADGSVARSDDGGAQWLEMASAGESGVYALDGAVSDRNGEQILALYAATTAGIARWNTETGAWQQLGELLSGQEVLGIALSPTFGEDETLLTSTQESALFVSQDGGATLHEITGSWQGQSLLRAHFGPEKAREIIALTVRPSDTGHFDITVWHSADLGRNWETMAGFSSGVPAVLVAWPQDGAERSLFLATQHRVIKLFYENQAPALQLHQHFFDEALRVTALATAPEYTHSRTIWAATTGGLYRSVDRGLSWGLMAALPQDLPVVSLDVGLTHINAITLGGRVWRAHL